MASTIRRFCATTTASVGMVVAAVSGIAASPAVAGKRDTTAPVVRLVAPAAGATVTAPSPTFSGAAGTSAGDSTTVRVRVYPGTSTTVSPVQTLSATASGGAWSVAASAALANGTYTAQASQSDAAGNVGASSANTFTVSVTAPNSGCSRSTSYSSLVLGEAGLVGYWRLGEASGTSACDAKGQDAGTYQPGTTLGRPGAIAGDSDTAVAFNGVSGAVTAPSTAALAVGDRFTAEAWVRRGALSTSDTQVIVSKQVGTWVLFISQSNQIVLRRSTVADVATSVTSITDTTTWHHVVATKDGPAVHLYLDGRDVTGPVTDQTMADNTEDLAIGRSVNSSFYNGVLDEVAVYNVPLTATQVSNHFAAGAPPPPPPPPPPAGDPVIAAAGDIACDPSTAAFNGGAGTAVACRQQSTSDLLAQNGPNGVLTLGDNQYDDGTSSKFSQVFGPSWGRFKSVTRPEAGNHDYVTAGAAGYFDYFNGSGNQTGAAGDRSKGYYSYDIGTWHLIALNSNCAPAGGCTAGSPQEQWLKADLAAHPTTCTLAYWHHPRFSSGWSGSPTATDALFQDLYTANADLVLVGHDHNYERFAPQNPSGGADTARGIREFVVGTGGENFDSLIGGVANSEVRNYDTFGVLRLTLHPSSYDWTFVPITGQPFTDSGTQACH